MNKIETIQARLLQFNTQFATLLRYPQAVQYLLSSLPAWLSATKAILLITRENEHVPSLERVHGFRPLTTSATLGRQDPLLALLQSAKAVVALPGSSTRSQHARRRSRNAAARAGATSSSRPGISNTNA